MDEAEQIVDAVGCLAEVLGVFFSQLRRQGMNDGQALTLTSQLLDIMTSTDFEE